MFAREIRNKRRTNYFGVWLSLARAPGLGPGGRRFESCHPDDERVGILVLKGSLFLFFVLVAPGDAGFFNIKFLSYAYAHTLK